MRGGPAKSGAGRSDYNVRSKTTFGYEDHWDNDGVFHYFGAGQVAHMTVVRGNFPTRSC